jgi:hypothetical protein
MSEADLKLKVAELKTALAELKITLSDAKGEAAEKDEEIARLVKLQRRIISSVFGRRTQSSASGSEKSR